MSQVIWRLPNRSSRRGQNDEHLKESGTMRERHYGGHESYAQLDHCVGEPKWVRLDDINARRGRPGKMQVVMDENNPPSPKTSIPEATKSTASRSPWKKAIDGLDVHIAAFLQFQHRYMTHYHYMLKLEFMDFVHDEMIEWALRFEPLVHVVIAFAAYHRSLQQTDSSADMESFWHYYHLSLRSLRVSLATGDGDPASLLLTILHLALVEEYIGSWSTLKIHREAAHQILINSYDPDLIMTSNLGRVVLSWFVRLDVVIWSIDESESLFGYTWLVHAYNWYKAQVDQNRGNSLENNLGCLLTGLQLARHDIARIGAMSVGSPTTGLSRNLCVSTGDVHRWLVVLKSYIDSLSNTSAANMVDKKRTPSCDAASNAGHLVFGNDLWAFNLIRIDWHRTYMLLCRKSHSTSCLGHNGVDSGLDITSQEVSHAEAQCRLVEAVMHWPHSPAGSVLACCPDFILSTRFLSRMSAGLSDTYIEQARSQIAEIERQGYTGRPGPWKSLLNDIGSGFE